ncbi:MAG: tRNA uridine-5-carboxymethylaminomethyl(34) synthesis GTPase MnmE [Nitrospirae bacterium]|nr:tRNA uridine-5-carboxymethylaminomethyl(34) synthesis GTPase MnmE [Nitrospirota bacterium]
MTHTRLTDTICAIATPLGVGGLGVVRLSGPNALGISSKIFSSQRHGATSSALEQAASHTVHHGWMIDPSSGEPVDEVLLTLMRTPHSYTREDTVEISGHGGPVVLARLLELCLSAGARLAEPGEFTKRAFLNGRLDLTQAEAVMALIHAESETAHRLALRQLRGEVAGSIRTIRDALIELLAQAEAGLDFVEQGLVEPPSDQWCGRLDAIQQQLAALIDSARVGELLREGIHTVIAGRPNVGKSSLFNRLLRKDRAIVTPFPGTTRDLLEEMLVINNFPLRLIDTAGIRTTPDPIEQEGMQRARRSIDDADLVLLVLDGSQPLQSDDRLLIDQMMTNKTIIIFNKLDVCEPVDYSTLAARRPQVPIVNISAVNGTGCDQLKEQISRLLIERTGGMSERAVITTSRHQQALTAAAEQLVRARQAAADGLSGECIASDLNEAIKQLGGIIGVEGAFTEELLDNIFNQFCIGK